MNNNAPQRHHYSLLYPAKTGQFFANRLRKNNLCALLFLNRLSLPLYTAQAQLNVEKMYIFNTQFSHITVQ
jgi:hypothetical protein